MPWGLRSQTRLIRGQANKASHAGRTLIPAASTWKPNARPGPLCPVAEVPSLTGSHVGAGQARFAPQGPPSWRRKPRPGSHVGLSPASPKFCGSRTRVFSLLVQHLRWVPRVLPGSLSSISTGRNSPTSHLCFPPTENGVKALVSQDSQRKRGPSSIIHNNRKGQTTQVPLRGQVVKENVVYPCRGILSVINGTTY